MNVHVFGIRHHGPGSARSLDAALDRLEPDTILIEGPPDADKVLTLASHSEMRPPVALLVHVLGQPQRAVFYPLAEFSPEWIALRRGLAAGVPVRCIDLPQAHRLALEEANSTAAHGPGDVPPATLADDPLTELARVAGFDDGERWWERMVEERGGNAEVFAAVADAMGELRAGLGREGSLLERRREAHMRQAIRAALKAGFTRIAVVCGAWHAPALRESGSVDADEELLRELPTVKVAATWVPWTHARLAMASGYGAGVKSPGWYRHLWCEAQAAPTKWLVRTARFLRDKDLDASSAQVIDAVRLAECLAALRGRPLVGLTDLTDAAEAVFTHGNSLPLRLIEEQLLIGSELGSVPRETPQLPLQLDLEESQRRLRMPARAEEKTYDLDLRESNDLERSRLLHRLLILGLDWGEEVSVGGKRGTFHEVWKLQWDPELAVALIAASIWGGTVEDAASARVREQVQATTELGELCRLLDRVLLSDLSPAVAYVVGRVNELAALVSDTAQILDALPPLANALRYGNVRKTSVELLEPIVAGLVVRASVGLPAACVSLDDGAAAQMAVRIANTDQAIQLLQRPEQATTWCQALERVLELPGVHGLVAGRVVRRLLEARVISAAAAAARFEVAVSHAVPPPQTAAWIEGFLSGSGTLLLHDDAFWSLVDRWVTSLSPERFIAVLPLLRRTFSTFAPPERRKLGERAQREAAGRPASAPGERGDFDESRAVAALPLLAKLLGLEPPVEGQGRG